MKTLKKTLCLVLAVVMAVGVLVLPANAAKTEGMTKYEDFDDHTEINDNYKTAVATLTGMGIITGKGTGYRPKATLTRQEAAVMVVNVMMNVKDKNAGLTGYSDQFTDIIDSTIFARKEINYLAVNGVISGVGDGKFSPNGTLSTYQLLTMLMRVAEKKNGYVPANSGEWKADAITFATDYGIYDDDALTSLFSGNLDDAPTREQTAQIIWDVITHSTTTAGSGFDVINKKTNAVVAKNVDAAQLAFWRAILDDDFSFEIASDITNSIAGKLYNLDADTDSDPFGRVTDTYINTANGDTYSAFPRVPVKTVYDQLSTKELFELLGYDTSKAQTMFAKYWEDGVTDKYFSGISKDQNGYVTLNSSASFTYGSAGATIEIYAAGTGTVDGKTVNMFDIVVINNYVATVNDDPDPEGEINLGTITPSYDSADAVTLKDVAAGTVKKGDVVVYNVDAKDGKVYNLQALTPAQGYIDAVSTSTDKFFRVNGLKNYYAAKTATGNVNAFGADFTPNKTTIYDVFTVNGFVAYVRIAQDAVAPSVPLVYTYVLDVDWVVGNDASSGNGALFPSDPTPYKDSQAKARILDLTTGTVRDVELLVVTDTDTAGTTHWYLANALGTKSTTEITAVENAKSKWQTSLKEHFASFVEIDGKYVLTGVPGDSTTALEKAATLTKNSPVVKVGSNSYYATNATKFVQVKGTNVNEVVTFTAPTELNGYASFTKDVPADGTTLEKALVVHKNGVVDVIYSVSITIPEKPSGEDEYDHVVYLGAGERDSNGYSYNFLIDGEVKSIYSTDSQNLTGDDVGKVYTLKTNKSDGKINGTPSGKSSTITGKLELVQTEYIVVAGQVYNLDAGCIIFDNMKTSSGAPKGLVTTYPELSKDVQVTVYKVGGTGSNKDSVDLVIINSYNA